jgi:hypothetical protein
VDLIESCKNLIMKLGTTVKTINCAEEKLSKEKRYEEFKVF